MTPESQIELLLSRCLELRQQGQPVCLAEVCADCPDLAPVLEERLGVVMHLEQLVKGLAGRPSQGLPGAALVSENLSETAEFGTLATALPSTLPSAAGTTEASRPAGTDLPRVSGYEMIQELGRGGMGVVFKARQVQLNRIVAVKMVLAGVLPTPEEMQRFRTEAEATAALRHPHIVGVHEVGQTEFGPYYCMDYIGGVSLAQRLASGPLPGKTAARYLVAIARAMQHAHECGVLHRDIKPANILLDANDQPHVSDFGLAKRLDMDSGQTRTGAIMGTPSYMAPEQAAGHKTLTAAVDVYSLGAVLYEMITGRPPFRAANPLDTVMQVLDRQPAPPRLLNASVDRDLEIMALKCLEKDPRRRYPSAGALAADLEKYLAGEAISIGGFSWCARFASLLDRSHFDVQFGSFARLFLALALLMLVTETAVNTAFLLDGSEWVGLLFQSMRLVLFGGLFWWFRPGGSLSPSSSAERLLWSLTLGYIIASILLGVTHRLLHGGSFAAEMAHYPKLAALTGMLFFAVGSLYWGWCYALGVGFFLLSLLMTIDLRWAGYAHGLMWFVALGAISLRLRRLGRIAS
jgi:serine/threonine-protein kinase